MSQQEDRVAAFRELHESGCFVMPNPWDVGSARVLADLGFPALATTSSGLAWSLGRTDNRVGLDETLAHLTAIASAVEVPVNADFEGGFAMEPDQVAVNVGRACETGIAGLSIEDSSGDISDPLIDFDLAVDRVSAARQAIGESSTGVLLTARSEGFVVGRPDLTETIRRLQAFAEAGADCLYAPGVTTEEEVSAIVAAVAPKPVNVLVNAPYLTVAEAAALGVRRLSVGGALARAAWGAFLQVAHQIAEDGTFSGFQNLPDVNARLRTLERRSDQPGTADKKV